MLRADTLLRNLNGSELILQGQIDSVCELKEKLRWLFITIRHDQGIVVYLKYDTYLIRVQ